MVKYFDIWRKGQCFYIALMSSKCYKTTFANGFEYIGTIESESPKMAIDKFYSENKNVITIKKCIVDDSKSESENIIIWAKKLRKEYPYCPMRTSLDLGKILFEKTRDTKNKDDFKFRQEDFPLINFSWIFLNNEVMSEDEKKCLFYEFFQEPCSLGFPPMFGEDDLKDEENKKVTDLIAQILTMVKSEDQPKVISLIREIENELKGNRIITY